MHEHENPKYITNMKPLTVFVEALRQELDQAIDRAVSSNRRVRLKVQKISMTLQVVAAEAKGVKGSVNFFAVTLGTDLSQNQSSTHSVTIEFVPLLPSTKPQPVEKLGSAIVIRSRATKPDEEDKDELLDFVLGRKDLTGTKLSMFQNKYGKRYIQRLKLARSAMKTEGVGNLVAQHLVNKSRQASKPYLKTKSLVLWRKGTKALRGGGFR